MPTSSLSRLAGRSLVAFAASAAAALFAQTPETALVPENVELERFIVSASRTPQDASFTPSSVTLLDLRELAEVQIVDLRTALAQEPGVIVVQTGSPGGPASIFMRGANGDHTLFVVDGIRMSDRSAQYLSFLGAADLANLGRLEVLRGPQSTLYGSSAMGGVILMESARGSGAPSGAVSAMVGSFESFGGAAAVAGSAGALRYSGSLSRYATANDIPDNALRQWTYATRLEYAAAADLDLGITFRAQNDEYEQTGSRLFQAPGFVTNDNYLGTVYADLRVTDTLRSRLTLGLHRRHYTFTDQWGLSELRNTRKVADWQNTWQPTETLEIMAGGSYERSRYKIEAAQTSDELAAGYLSGTWHLTPAVTATAGLRHDRFDTVGNATTGRAGVSYRPLKGTKLRVTHGTGFAAPGSADRYGVPQWAQLPNPDLEPEKARGWDAGIDQDLFGRGTLSLTYFQNRFRNLFGWEYVDPATFQGRTANRARAKTKGVEVGLQLRLTDTVQTRFSYTYLEAKDTGSGERLLRRPRHVIDGELRLEPNSVWSMGAGIHAVADRVDLGGSSEDYTTVRVFTSYAVREDLILKLRVENALDEDYEEVLGYAALPRGIFGAVEWFF